MADTNAPSPTPKRRHGWLRILGVLLGVLVLLLVVVYFVATSSAFFKGVILPKVSKAMNADVTVSDASIHPFKEVVLSHLKVQAAGPEPLLTAPEVRLRYSLMDIIGGRINVDLVSVSKPTITVIENPDGSHNYDPILQAQKEKPEGPEPQPEPGKPSKPAQIDLKKLTITDATIRQIKLYAGGQRDQTELSHLNVNLENVKNGQTGKLGLGADISLNNNPPAPGTNGLLQATLNGTFNFALTQDLKPASVQGDTRLTVTRAEGGLAQLAALGASLDCNVTPTDIKQVALRFQKGDTRLGEMRVSGPFNMEKTEGRLTAELFDIDKRLLNLAGASSGIDFGPTRINSTNEIQLAKSGTLITTVGRFNLNQFQVTRTNQTTPAMDLRAEYDVTVDQAASNAVLRAFTLNGTQKGNQFLRGELTSPMTISWGNTANAVGDSALNLTVTHLDLADWKAFLGEVAPAGDVNMKSQLISQRGGKLLTFNVDSAINNLTAGSGSNQITQAAVTLTLRGQATDLQQFNLPEYKLQVSRQNQPLVHLAGSGTYDQASSSADMQLNGQLMLARLLQAVPQPDMNVSSGTAEMKVHLTQKALTALQQSGTTNLQTVQNLVGSFTLADFSGQVGSNSFRSFGTTADFDIGVTPRQAEIRKLAGKITEGVTVGGTYSLAGTYDLTNQSAQLTAKLANFNQAGLRPFLEPMLADKKLTSVALNANATAQYNAQGVSAVKAELQVTNLVVSDPKGQVPATPLEAKMLLDASLNQQVADLRQVLVALTPTARATNQIQLTGRVDMSQTNATQGNLKIAAESLDVTRYYELFAGQETTEAAPAAPSTTTPAPAATPAKPEQEPEATQLPFRNFTAETAIGRFYLREVEITNLLVTAKIDGGRVLLNPCQLALNGAPVKANVDLNLGVAGYKYDTSFSADAIPLAPLVNSFAPERKGQLGGTLTAQARVAGAGITGPSLQKHLSGQFDVGTTNLNLDVVHIRNPLLKALINVVGVIPELVRNPENFAGTLLSSLAPRTAAGTQGGLATELSKSPIDKIVLRGNMGNGRVTVQQALVQSPAFLAEAPGTVGLTPVLTNSTIEFPVSLSLSRPLAARINMVPANTPTNAAYVKLPDFLTMRGTVGQPKTDINKMALAGSVLKSLGGAGSDVGKAGNVIQGLGGLLGGRAPVGTNVPAARTNQPGGKLGGLLQGLGGVLGGPAATNTPGSSTNAPATNQSPVGNLLNQFLKK